MEFNYISTKKAAKIMSVTERYVQMLCKEGKIEGTIKFNEQGVWLIPQKAILRMLDKSKER